MVAVYACSSRGKGGVGEEVESADAGRYCVRRGFAVMTAGRVCGRMCMCRCISMRVSMCMCMW